MNNTKGDQTAQKKCENPKGSKKKKRKFLGRFFSQMKEISCEKENKKNLLRIPPKENRRKRVPNKRAWLNNMTLDEGDSSWFEVRNIEMSDHEAEIFLCLNVS